MKANEFVTEIEKYLEEEKEKHLDLSPIKFMAHSDDYGYGFSDVTMTKMKM